MSNNGNNGKKNKKNKKKNKSNMESQDRKISAPAAKSTRIHKKAPEFRQLPNGSIRVRNREYIRDVNGSVAFSNILWAVNPGLFDTFPWLSTLASRFESYKFHSLAFEFEPDRGSNVAGTVMLGMDYDPSDIAASTKQQLMSYGGSMRTVVWDKVKFVADRKAMAKLGPERYVRMHYSAPADALKTSDVGSFQMGVMGMVDASIVGELYVSYDIELITPQYDLAEEYLASSFRHASNGTVALGDPFGTTAGTVTGGIQINCLNDLITFYTPGQYIGLIEYTCATATDTNPTIAVSVGAGTVTQSFGAGQTHNVALTRASTVFQVNATTVPMVLDFGFAGSAASITASVVDIGYFSTQLAL